MSVNDTSLTAWSGWRAASCGKWETVTSRCVPCMTVVVATKASRRHLEGQLDGAGCATVSSDISNGVLHCQLFPHLWALTECRRGGAAVGKIRKHRHHVGGNI